MLDFAFTSGALDRAAHLRFSATPLEGNAPTMVFWRGKLLVDGSGATVPVPLDHPALGDARENPLFLGLTPDGPRYAADLALWSPLEDAATIGEFVDRSEQVHPAWPGAKFVEIRGIMASLTQLEGVCAATARALFSWHSTHRFCANCGSATASGNGGWVRKCAACGTNAKQKLRPPLLHWNERTGALTAQGAAASCKQRRKRFPLYPSVSIHALAGKVAEWPKLRPELECAGPLPTPSLSFK